MFTSRPLPRSSPREIKVDILLDPMERVCNEALVRAEEKNLAMEALYDVQCTGSLLGRLLLVN